MAQQTDYPRFQWGGMNRILNPFLIKPGDLKLCLNYNSDIFYAKKRRSGYTTFLDNPDSSQVYSLIPFERADTYRFVLRISGTNIYKYAFTGNTWGTATRTNFGGFADPTQTVADAHEDNAKITSTTIRVAQSFKLSGSGSKFVPSLSVCLNTIGAPGTINVRLETDNAGSPSGTAVTNAIGSMAFQGAGSVSWYNLVFTIAPTLTAGTTYWLVLSASAPVDASNYYQAYGALYDVYLNGSAKYSTNSGTSYAILTGQPDLSFAINVTGGSRCGSVILNNKLILGNGINKTCYTTDGVNFTDIADAPPVKYMIVWKGRVYAAGAYYAQSRLYYSKSNDPTSWTSDATLVSSGGFLDIDPDDNGGIIGLDVESGRLIVHKTGGSYRVMPDEFGRPSQVTPIGEATTSHWSIGHSENFNIGYFYGIDGFFEHNGETPKLISSSIQDLVEGVAGTVEEDLVGQFFQYKYYCTMGTSITESERLGGRTYTNPIFVYDVRLQESYLYTVADVVSCFSSWKTSIDVANLYMGDTSGVTYVWGGGNLDNDTAINGELETWDDDFGSPHINKRYEFISLEMNPGCEASALYNLDGEEYKSLGDVSEGTSLFYFGDGGFNKKNISIKITDSSTTTPSIFCGFVLRLTGEEEPEQAKTRAK